MIKAAITGGIGSGKSTVCRIFSILGIPVYNADKEAKILTNSDPEIRKQLIELAGENVYSMQELNRKHLSGLIFNNKEILQEVNRIIHPRVESNFIQWLSRNAAAPYIVYESAILIGSRMADRFDQVITVIAPEEIRIGRVLTRENMTLSLIRNIIKNQPDENEMIRKSQHIIINDNKTLVIPQVLKLHGLLSDLK